MNENKKLMSSEELLKVLESQAAAYRTEYEQLLQQSEELNLRQQKINVRIEQVRGSYTSIIQTINTIKGVSEESAQQPQQSETAQESSKNEVNQQTETTETSDQAILSNVVNMQEHISQQPETVQQEVETKECSVSDEEKEKIKQALEKNNKSKPVKKSQLVNREDVPDYLMPDYEDKIKQ